MACLTVDIRPAIERGGKFEDPQHRWAKAACRQEHVTRFHFVRRGTKFAIVGAQPPSPLIPLLAAAMRITRRILTQVLLPFLILGLPPTGATLDGSAVGVGENRGFMEGSDGGFLALLSNANSLISVFVHQIQSK